MNDVAYVNKVRDELARLAHDRVKERELLAELTQAGIPEAVLVGPLRPAFVDGSNVANMSPERHGHLAYLDQIRASAWAEGYFPVTIIVDASLRYQIDQPDALMTRVERGEILMAPAGTSADELLIEEAQTHHGIIITNDRMTNWPAAKSLEKRHAVLECDSARLGSFHRSAFFW
jgi:hypothetical protein